MNRSSRPRLMHETGRIVSKEQPPFPKMGHSVCASQPFLQTESHLRPVFALAGSDEDEIMTRSSRPRLVHETGRTTLTGKN